MTTTWYEVLDVLQFLSGSEKSHRITSPYQQEIDNWQLRSANEVYHFQLLIVNCQSEALLICNLICTYNPDTDESLRSHQHEVWFNSSTTFWMTCSSTALGMTCASTALEWHMPRLLLTPLLTTHRLRSTIRFVQNISQKTWQIERAALYL